MITTQELLGRERKVAKIIDAMDRVLRHRVTADEAANLSLEIMTVVITLADVRPPSLATVDAIADRLIERDDRFSVPAKSNVLPMQHRRHGTLVRREDRQAAKDGERARRKDLRSRVEDPEAWGDCPF